MHSTDVFNEERAAEFPREPRRPDWQKAIREAQSKKIEAAMAASKKREQEQAEEQRELGAKLAKALGFLGIELDEAPDRNLVVLDDYEFSLQESNMRDYDTHWMRAWAYSEYSHGAAEDDLVRFTLYIAPRGWHEAGDGDWLAEVRQEEIRIEDHEIAGDWSDARAELADKIDSLDFRVGLERKSAGRRVEEPAQSEPTAPVSRDGLAVLANRIEDDPNYQLPTDVATAMALLDLAHSLREIRSALDSIVAHGFVTYPEH